MEQLLKIFAHYCHLSQTQYWHLHLLLSLMLGPLLGVLYLIFFDQRARRRPSALVDSRPTMWVGSDGRLLYYR